MEIEMNRHEFTIHKLITTKSKTITVEGDMIVPDSKPDILNTIDNVGTVCIYKEEVLEGKVRMDGGINIYSIYLADSEEDTVRSLNTTLDFTQVIEADECMAGMDVVTHINIKNTQCKVLNGRKISLSAELEIQMQVYSNETVQLLKEIDPTMNVQTLNSNMNINTLVGSGKTKITAKDVISYGEEDELAEILKAEVKIMNQEVKISYHKILLKADTNVKIMYLTEDNEIKIINTSIPTMGFVEMSDVEDTNLIDVDYEIRNMMIKPCEDHGISIEIEIEAFVRAYGETTIEVIQDLYSTESNITFTTKTIETQSEKQEVRRICHIQEGVTIPEIAYQPLYDVEITPMITTANILNGKIVYKGEVNLHFLYGTLSSSGMETRELTFPFHFEIEEGSIAPNKKILTQLECIEDNFIIQADGNIDCTIDLQFNLEVTNHQTIKLIDEIQIGEDRKEESYSMVIYIVKPNDTLWDIAKKNKVTVESIKELNILENEKLQVGEKLYLSRRNHHSNTIGA